MRFLRRNTADQTATMAGEGVEVAPALEGVKGKTAGKGRPTPKRREAEGRRRGPVPPPPRTQREAMRRMRGNKAERRQSAQTRRERMMAGDDKYLLPRDKGPVRAYVRDLVDSRRNLLGLFMPLALVVFVSLFAATPQIQQYASLFCMFMLLAMIVEGIILGRIVVRRVRAKFPEDTSRGFGLGWYAFTRASQLRKLRMPRARVKRGEAI